MNDVVEAEAEAMARWRTVVRELVAAATGQAPDAIDLARSWQSTGLDSIELLRACVAVRDRFGVAVLPSAFVVCESLDDFAVELARRAPSMRIT